jgi:hypothetical protein
MLLLRIDECDTASRVEQNFLRRYDCSTSNNSDAVTIQYKSCVCIRYLYDLVYQSQFSTFIFLPHARLMSAYVLYKRPARCPLHMNCIVTFHPRTSRENNGRQLYADWCLNGLGIDHAIVDALDSVVQQVNVCHQWSLSPHYMSRQ